MDFDASVVVTNGGTDPDPIASPGSVVDGKMVAIRAGGATRASDTSRLLLALEGTGAETVTVELYALDRASLQPPGAPVAADRRFYRIATGVVVTNGILQEVTALVPNAGPIYIRVTAETVAADRILKIAASNQY